LHANSASKWTKANNSLRRYLKSNNMGNRNYLAHRRNRLRELSDQVGEVRVIVRVISEVLGMKQLEILGDQLVAVDGITSPM
jgi:hypothetical protein